jgi:hypothetical protein
LAEFSVYSRVRKPPPAGALIQIASQSLWFWELRESFCFLPSSPKRNNAAVPFARKTGKVVTDGTQERRKGRKRGNETPEEQSERGIAVPAAAAEEREEEADEPSILIIIITVIIRSSFLSIGSISGGARCVLRR